MVLLQHVTGPLTGTDKRMTIFFSQTTNGFYDDAIFERVRMPADVVGITYAQWQALLEGQSQGKRITGDDQGRPVLAEQLPPTAEEVRMIRNTLLQESDWSQLADVPQAIKEPWVSYRQTLRDIPTQPGFPASVMWPTPPTN